MRGGEKSSGLNVLEITSLDRLSTVPYPVRDCIKESYEAEDKIFLEAELRIIMKLVSAYQ